MCSNPIGHKPRGDQNAERHILPEWHGIAFRAEILRQRPDTARHDDTGQYNAGHGAFERVIKPQGGVVFQGAGEEGDLHPTDKPRGNRNARHADKRNEAERNRDIGEGAKDRDLDGGFGILL